LVKTSPETCRADWKRSINRHCCILLVTYTIVLMMHGHTNISIVQFTNMKYMHLSFLSGMWCQICTITATSDFRFSLFISMGTLASLINIISTQQQQHCIYSSSQ
jgi:hypothetical protein